MKSILSPDSVHSAILPVLVCLLAITGCSSPINPSSFEQPAEDVFLFDLSNTTDDGVPGPDTTGNDMGSLDTGIVDLVEGDSALDTGSSDLVVSDTSNDSGSGNEQFVDTCEPLDHKSEE